MMFRLWVLGWLLALMGMAQAQPFQVSQIEVEGLQRVSLGTVLRALPMQRNDQVDTENSADWLRALYATGYFTDVRVLQDGRRLIFVVTERPAIEAVSFTGNKSIPSDTLERVMADIGLVKGEIFSQSLLEGIELELERQYALQGRYNASVEPEVTALSLNRVRLRLVITEGPVAKIDRIEITGNEVFTDDELLAVLQLRETSRRYPLQFIQRRNRFGQAQLTGDLARLEDYYLDRGYLDFRLDSHQVSISENKADIAIILNLFEGEPYRISSVELAGELSVLETPLSQLLTVQEGDPYARIAINDDRSAIIDALGAEGYAFADVAIQLEPDTENRRVALTIQVNPGKPVYVNRIEISGNIDTNDEVIRRELRQLERGLLINRNIRLSRARLQRLGYFSRVDIRTQRIVGRDDLVDIIVEVEESTNRQITGSLGYSDASGVFVEAKMEQKNFQGKGYDFAMSATVNESETNYNLSFDDPYFTVNGVSRGIDLYYRQTDFSEANFSTYATNTAGGRLKLGYPLSENQRLNYAVSYSRDELFLNDSAPQEMAEFKAENGDQYDIIEGRVSWNYNSLNGTFKASEGRRLALTTEVATPLGDLSYYRLTADLDQYFAINDDYSFRLHSNLGYGQGYGETSALPFYKHFRAGGARSIRGFQFGSLGPLSTPSLDDEGNPLRSPSPFGGNIKLEYGAELIIPTPLVKDQSPYRLSLFIDGGNVFTDYCHFDNLNCREGVDLSELRYSVGVDFTWITPIAPLSFSYAWPLNAADEDSVQNFAFNIGIAY